MSKLRSILKLKNLYFARGFSGVGKLFIVLTTTGLSTLKLMNSSVSPSVTCKNEMSSSRTLF